MMTKESLLWDQLRAGDENALRIIYDKYFDILINYGMRLSPHHELVEDSVQELFIDIWNLRSGISATDSIKNYLLCSFRRKLFRKLKLKIQFVEDAVLEDKTNSEPDFLNQLILQEEGSKLQIKLSQAMETLSSRQKEAIFLKFQDGLDYDAICEVMDLKYQSVRNLISTGISRLRENLVTLFILWNIFEYMNTIQHLLNLEGLC